MSMCYWLIEGIGIDASKLIPFIDNKKFAEFLVIQLPDNDFISEVVSQKKYDELDFEDFLHGYPFDNLADLLTFCDDTDTLVYGNDGENGYYLYYPPSMPWHRVSNEPNNVEEVHQRIIAAASSITNLSSDEIENMIDDELYVVGGG